MKLVYTSGCVCGSLSIDGVETIDMDINVFKDVLQQLIINEGDLVTLQEVYMLLMSSQGVYECSEEPCECCGDYVTTYSLEI